MKKHQLMIAACFMFLTGKPAFSATFDFDLVITDSYELHTGYDFETDQNYRYEGMIRREGWHVGDTVHLSIDYTPTWPTCDVAFSYCAFISAGLGPRDDRFGGDTALEDQSDLSDSVQQHSLSASVYLGNGNYNAYALLTFFMYDETINFLDDSGNLNMSDDFEQSSLARASLYYELHEIDYASDWQEENSMSASYEPTTLEPAPVAPVPVPPAFWLFGSGVLSMLLGMRRSFSRGSYQGG
jgi:hypothetical protein